MFPLLIFDLDGTLVDSRKDLALSVNLTLADLGYPPLQEETVCGYVGNGVYRLLSDATKSEDPEEMKRVLTIFDGHYMAHLTDQTQLYAGMEEVLAYYRFRKKAVVTNKPAKFTRKILENLGVVDCFECLVSGDEAGFLKPHPAMILHLLTRLNVSPNEAVAIGDMEQDIQAARRAGIRVCAVGYGLGDPMPLKAAGPDFFAETVADLTALPL